MPINSFAGLDFSDSFGEYDYVQSMLHRVQRNIRLATEGTRPPSFDGNVGFAHLDPTPLLDHVKNLLNPNDLFFQRGMIVCNEACKVQLLEAQMKLLKPFLLPIFNQSQITSQKNLTSIMDTYEKVLTKMMLIQLQTGLVFNFQVIRNIPTDQSIDYYLPVISLLAGEVKARSELQPLFFNQYVTQLSEEIPLVKFLGYPHFSVTKPFALLKKISTDVDYYLENILPNQNVDENNGFKEAISTSNRLNGLHNLLLALDYFYTRNPICPSPTKCSPQDWVMFNLIFLYEQTSYPPHSSHMLLFLADVLPLVAQVDSDAKKDFFADTLKLLHRHNVVSNLSEEDPRVPRLLEITRGILNFVVSREEAQLDNFNEDRKLLIIDRLNKIMNLAISYQKKLPSSTSQSLVRDLYRLNLEGAWTQLDIELREIFALRPRQQAPSCDRVLQQAHSASHHANMQNP